MNPRRLPACESDASSYRRGVPLWAPLCRCDPGRPSPGVPLPLRLGRPRSDGPTVHSRLRLGLGSKYFATRHKRGDIVKSKNRMCATRVLVLVTFVFASSGALAQNEQNGKPSQEPTTALESADKNRGKRADPSLSEEKAEQKTTKDSDEPIASATVANTNDLESVLLGLRDEIAATSDPRERAQLQVKLADQLALNNRKQEAIAELYSITAEDRFDPQVFYNVANALVRLGELDGAVNVYRKAIDQRKGRYSRAFNNLGVVLLRQGRWEEAYEAFMSALRLEGFRYAEASYNLGHLYAVRGERDLAIREWQRAVAVDPEHTAAKRVLSNEGRVGNIIVVTNPASPVRSSAVGAPSRPTKISKSNPIIKDTETNSASPGSSLGLTLDSSTYNLLKRARTARERGRTTEALENYSQVIARKDGYFPPANLELSNMLFSLKRNDEALATLLPVTQRDGASFPISYYHAARLYELRGDLKLAEENYNRAIESFTGNNSQFILDLSRVREKLGDFSGALSAMEQYVSSMRQQGQLPRWSEERLTLLRQKVAASQKQPKQ